MVSSYQWCAFFSWVTHISWGWEYKRIYIYTKTYRIKNTLIERRKEAGTRVKLLLSIVGTFTSGMFGWA